MDNPSLINKYIEKLNDEVIDATKRRIVAESQVALLNENVQAQNENLETLKAEAEELIASLNDEINRLTDEKQKEIDDLGIQINELNSSLDSKQSEIELLRQRNQGYVAEIGDLTQRQIVLEESIKKQRLEIYELNKKFQEMTENIPTPVVKKKKVTT